MTCGCCAQAVEPVLLLPATPDAPVDGIVEHLTRLVTSPPPTSPRTQTPSSHSSKPLFLVARAGSTGKGIRMRMGREPSRSARSCVFTPVSRPRKAGDDAGRGSGAGARTRAADCQRAAGDGGSARPAVRRIRAASGEPRDRRCARQSQRPGPRFTDFEVGLASRSSRVRAGRPGLLAPMQRSRRAPPTRRSHSNGASLPRRLTTGGSRQRAHQLLTARSGSRRGVYAAADRRFKAGDIAVLDVNIARASLARVSAEREGAEPRGRWRLAI